MSMCEPKWCETTAAKTHWTAHLTSNQTQSYTMKLFLLPYTHRAQHTGRSTSMACQKRVNGGLYYQCIAETVRRFICENSKHLTDLPVNNTNILYLSYSFSPFSIRQVIGQSRPSSPALALWGHISKLFWMEHQTCGQLTSAPPQHSCPNHCTVVARGRIPLLFKTLNTGLELSMEVIDYLHHP